MIRQVLKFISSAAVLSCLMMSFSSSAEAEENNYTTFNTPRFTLYFDSDRKGSDDGVFTKNVADRAIDILDRTASEYGRVFGGRPTNKVVLKFLAPDEFRRQTGAPAWTSAMFYRGEISIPIVKAQGMNFNELHRALRHEYVHAVIAELSEYRCPAWLDEGVAQLLEGQPNPLLGPAMRKWVGANDAMPLDWLQNGFTTLDSKIVPAAYAQSLFATRTLVNTYGFSAVVTYLKELKKGSTEPVAFKTAFGLERAGFESGLTNQMKLWSSSGLAHP